MGFLPIATRKALNISDESIIRVKAKATQGQVRLGISAKKNIDKDAWTRNQFIYLDGNQSNLGKNSNVSYNFKQLSEDL